MFQFCSCECPRPPLPSWLRTFEAWNHKVDEAMKFRDDEGRPLPLQPIFDKAFAAYSAALRASQGFATAQKGSGLEGGIEVKEELQVKQEDDEDVKTGVN